MVRTWRPSGISGRLLNYKSYDSAVCFVLASEKEHQFYSKASNSLEQKSRIYICDNFVACLQWNFFR